MNYRHIYHAGNFADVFKHWILTLLLEKLCEKPTPYCVLDTHAGLGWYDLTDDNAEKTQEKNSGVEKILNKTYAPAFQAYYDIIKSNYIEGNIYPGSPKIIQSFLRAQDRLFAAELHPEDFLQLQQNFEYDKQVKVLQQDAYQAMRAILPPLEKRGLVLIDPPFEDTDEFEQITKAIGAGLKRFAHGMYAIWYPIKDQHQVKNFYKQLKDLQLPKTLYVELHANISVLNQLNSCGMLIINPPWKLDQILQENMPKLLQDLEFDLGTYKIEWLVSE